MSLITIILFFIYTYGFGYTATYFLNKNDNFLERNIMRIGIGLGILPIIMLLLSYLRIPLDWRLMLLLSIIFPLYSIFSFFKNKGKIKFNPKIKKSDLYILAALALFLLSLFMYVKGAFVYPYLEDDDSWSHANGVKYVSIQKSIFNPNRGTGYLDPYPPAYDGLLGLLHQTSSSLMWTMKFFNALIISLSILFFYFFSKEFIGSQKKALFATFVLASIPSYLSHFIWSHSLIPPLFILAFYSIEMQKQDKKYMYISALVIGSIFVTQPTQPIKFAIMLLSYFLVKFIYDKKLPFHVLSAGALGFLVSLLWWATRWKTQLGTWSEPTLGAGTTVTLTLAQKIGNLLFALKGAFDPRSGTATRVYTFEDFFIAKHQNLINNPVGIGVVLSILFLMGLIFIIAFLTKELIKNKDGVSKMRLYLGGIILAASMLMTLSVILFKSLLSLAYLLSFLMLALFIVKSEIATNEKEKWIVISLMWALFTFLGINSLTFNLPVGLFAFRFWMLFAIPLALLSVLGMWFLFSLGGKFNVPNILILLVVIVGVALTSAHQKYSVNTAMWPPGAFWTSMEELQGHLFLKNLPPNTKVFTFSNFGPINGFDKFFCSWCKEDQDFRTKGFNESAITISSWMKSKAYNYLVVDGQAARTYGANETNTKINELLSSGLFKLVHSTGGFILLQTV